MIFLYINTHLEEIFDAWHTAALKDDEPVICHQFQY